MTLQFLNLCKLLLLLAIVARVDVTNPRISRDSDNEVESELDVRGYLLTDTSSPFPFVEYVLCFFFYTAFYLQLQGWWRRLALKSDTVPVLQQSNMGRAYGFLFMD